MEIGIGEFARLGGVSVRTLHHYDAVGLLRPARVDEHSGRRRYDVAQLRDLSRVVTLKELGFTLQEVAGMLDRDPGDAAVRELLVHRRAGLERRLAETRHRLAQLDARLRLLDGDDGEAPVVVRDVPAMRVAALSAVLRRGPGYGREVEALFVRASDLMDAAGLARTTPVGRFVPVTGGSVHVLAGFEVVDGAPDGMVVEQLPAVRVASAVHHGPMSGIEGAFALLGRWGAGAPSADGRGGGLRTDSGPNPPPTDDDGDATAVRRWLFLEADGEDQTDWVVEAQVELPAG